MTGRPGDGPVRDGRDPADALRSIAGLVEANPEGGAGGCPAVRFRRGPGLLLALGLLASRSHRGPKTIGRLPWHPQRDVRGSEIVRPSPFWSRRLERSRSSLAGDESSGDFGPVIGAANPRDLGVALSDGPSFRPRRPASAEPGPTPEYAAGSRSDQESCWPGRGRPRMRTSRSITSTASKLRPPILVNLALRPRLADRPSLAAIERLLRAYGVLRRGPDHCPYSTRSADRPIVLNLDLGKFRPSRRPRTVRFDGRRSPDSINGRSETGAWPSNLETPPVRLGAGLARTHGSLATATIDRLDTRTGSTRLEDGL